MALVMSHSGEFAVLTKNTLAQRKGGRYHFWFIYYDQDRIVPEKQVMDAAFSYDYYRFVLRKQIIHTTFSNSEKLPQDHYK